MVFSWSLLTSSSPRIECFLVCLTYRGSVCFLKKFSSLCPFPFLFCSPPLSQDHPAAVLWDLQTVTPLNRLSKLRTPQAWKKLYTHDNVFHRSKQQTSDHYIHKVVLANICILTNNGLPKTLVDQEIRDIMCGPLLYRLCSLNQNMEGDFIPRKVRVRHFYFDIFAYKRIPEVFKTR